MSSKENFYSLSQEELFNKLKTSLSGLSKGEAQKRLDEYGPNKLTSKKKVSPLSIFLSQFKNNLILILIGSSLLVFFVYFFGEKDQSDLIEGGLILAIVLMITVLGFFQEFKAEKAVEALKKLLAFKAKVMRDNREIEVEVTELVPGDIVILEEGEKIPADIRLLEVSSLGVMEASLTGESNPVSKQVEAIQKANLQIADQKNMVFSGTVVTSGRGLGVVITTGDKTEIGKIATSVTEVEEEPTPIQIRLDQIGKILGYTVLGIAAVVFIFIFFLSNETAGLPVLQRTIKAFIASVALAVAAIPEGLPAVVTIALALGTQRMLRRKALVRKLNSIETLGSTDVICSDKTGTLTKGEMTVQEVYFDGKDYQISGVGYSPNGSFSKDGQKIDPRGLELILKAGAFCNNAVLRNTTEIGDPTEAALLVSAKKAGVEVKGKRLLEIPFSSERKRMSVLVEEDKGIFVYTKGAPEIVLSRCSRIFKNNEIARLTEADKKTILDQVEMMSEKALRNLAIAYKPIKEKTTKEEEIENDLIFLGLQGMIDPPREEVKPLIEKCTSSGVRVIMITGDHQATAQAVASQIGLPGKSLSGEELDRLSESEFEKAVEQVNIYARVSPNFKMRIVEALQKHDHIVAMTGDGVNDAPAVKKADIGVAMGITGTDVSKEASDMVLLDDNFSTIVNAIEEGRGIFQNIRKFVNYLLSCNIGEVIVVFVAVILLHHIPLTAVMLLWINVITDGLPAVALGLDPPEKNIMRYSPKKFQEDIISPSLWLEMVIFGILLTIGVLGIYWHNLPEGLEEARAAAFMAIIFFELVRLLIIRADANTPLLANFWLVAAVIASILLQVAIVYIPFLANLFEVKHIDLFDWTYIIIGSLVLWVVFEGLRKLLNRIPLGVGNSIRSRQANL